MEERILQIPISNISPNPYQPREKINPAELQGLAESIKNNGIIQPLLLRRIENGYQLIAGERRINAAKMVGLKTVPVIVKEATDSDMLRLALIENLQRENLNPIEEAKAYRELITKFRFTQESLADVLGKKRTTVTNSLRLLTLPPDIQEEIINGRITPGHARVILSIANNKDKHILAEKIIRGQLSVRRAEELAQEYQKKLKFAQKKRKVDPIIASAEEELMSMLGLRVAIKANKLGSGKLEIFFANADELNRLMEYFNMNLG
jgi:ParB family chromosome partitioning protein